MDRIRVSSATVGAVTALVAITPQRRAGLPARQGGVQRRLQDVAGDGRRDRVDRVSAATPRGAGRSRRTACRPVAERVASPTGSPSGSTVKPNGAG